ncbi:MAG TPA: hypothetical protein VM009_02750 [Terriglobales bacterium]|nr:hypothetical protein [Terriglobales bacterium]
MRFSSARVLEFDSLREIVGAYASSALGKQRIAALAPSQDRVWIESQHRMASEIRTFYRAGGRFEFAGLLDPTMWLEKSRIQGAALEIDELRNILTVADRAAQWRMIGLNPPATLPQSWPAHRRTHPQDAGLHPTPGILW